MQCQSVIIRSAEFVKSALTPDQYPPESVPEIAFAGRSNTGKSSLINALVNRKGLAKASASPGLTRFVNFFLVNRALYFVDLPGYGYARASHGDRDQWKPMVESYAASRGTLKGMVVVSDIRRDPAEEEKVLRRWLNDKVLPSIWVLSKADKLSRSDQAKQRVAVAGALSVNREDLIIYSSKTGQGKDEIWGRILTLAPSLPPAFINGAHKP